MPKYRVYGHVFRREDFYIDVEAEDETEARYEAENLWAEGCDDFEYLNEEGEGGFDADETEQLD